MTDKTFLECMALLQSSFGQAETGRIKALRFALGEMDDQELSASTRAVIRSFKPTASCPFPVPADFLVFSDGTEEDRANSVFQGIMAAVHKVGGYKSVSFGSDAVHGVISRFGGWTAICGMTQAEWDINEGRFLSALKSALRHDTGYSGEHCAGIIERTNGYLRPSDLVTFSVKANGRLVHKANVLIENKAASKNKPIILEVMGQKLQIETSGKSHKI